MRDGAENESRNERLDDLDTSEEETCHSGLVDRKLRFCIDVWIFFIVFLALVSNRETL